MASLSGTAHRDIMRRRREWFARMESYMMFRRAPFRFRHPLPSPDAQPVQPILDECA